MAGSPLPNRLRYPPPGCLSARPRRYQSRCDTERAEAKDYIDIDALLLHGIDLARILAAGTVVYGRRFNPLITLKALSYFNDVPTLPQDVRLRLRRAVESIDPGRLPLKP